MILMTGRRLEHYYAGTMTRRTANLALLPTERMDLHPAGDDLGDLSAFAAAFELKARGGDVLRVAVDSAEAPPALIEQADVIVDGPAGLLEFLRRLLV